MTYKTVNLPSITFKSKSAAIEYFKEMLNRYNDGDELSSNDDEILFELLQCHPEMEGKIGVGVNRFYRDNSPIHPTSCFHIERIDGTTTDFSGSLRNLMGSFFNTTALNLFAYPASHSKTVFLPGSFRSYEILERRPLTSESYC